MAFFRATEGDLRWIRETNTRPPSGGWRARYLIRHYVDEATLWHAALIGTIIVVASLVGYFTMSGNGALGIFMLVGGVTGGMAMILFGLVHGLWLTRVATRGTPSVARVISVAPTGFHDEVAGELDVTHPLGSFTETFNRLGEWGPTLRPGSWVDVLVDPQRPRVLVVLGPRDE